jgi:galactokinase
MDLQQLVQIEFNHRFGAHPGYLIRAPGRVNLIGEHTDYNEGFVLPMAIDRAIWLALRPRSDRRVQLHSLGFEQPADFSLDAIVHGAEWTEYIRGVAWALRESGLRLEGWEGVLASNIPAGSGLSSSAALEIATGMAFSVAGGWPFEPISMARAGQLAENEWLGAKTGIMDQMASACGMAGHAILIDCRSLQFEPAPLPLGANIIVLDTRTRRGLVDSAYNERRAQCEAAAKHFGVQALRDVSIEQFADAKEGLVPVAARRARHVISENQRVLEAVAAMKAGETIRLGLLLNASHASLRDDFEVSRLELDTIVEIAQQQPGCFGSRLTGAGFGGCALALVEAGQSEFFMQAVQRDYLAATGLEAGMYICQAVDGASYQTIDSGAV